MVICPAGTTAKAAARNIQNREKKYLFRAWNKSQRILTITIPDRGWYAAGPSVPSGTFDGISPGMAASLTSTIPNYTTQNSTLHHTWLNYGCLIKCLAHPCPHMSIHQVLAKNPPTHSGKKALTDRLQIGGHFSMFTILPKNSNTAVLVSVG